MLIKLNERNHITIDPQNGCRIQQLTLNGKTIIKSQQNENFLGSGSYLMFPWVNRVVENPYQKLIGHKFTDGKGYPLHGLYMNTKRVIKTLEVKENNKITGIEITVKNAQENEQIHNFIETFILQQNTLQLWLIVRPSPKDPNPYCFGYHPYFELSKPIAQIEISTNLSRQLSLHEDLRVKWPQQAQQWNGKIDPKQKYDSLFQSQKQWLAFVELDDGVNKLRIQSDLKYWQIYTPDDGKRIAIEPMSFHGGLYEIVKQAPHVRESLREDGVIKISVQ